MQGANPEISVSEHATDEQRAAVEIFKNSALTNSNHEISTAISHILETKAERVTEFSPEAEGEIKANEEIQELIRQRDVQSARKTEEGKRAAEDLTREIIKKRFILMAGWLAVASAEQSLEEHDVA